MTAAAQLAAWLVFWPAGALERAIDLLTSTVSDLQPRLGRAAARAIASQPDASSLGNVGRTSTLLRSRLAIAPMTAAHQHKTW